MSKKSARIITPALIIIVSCLLFSPKLSFANHEEAVLGDSATNGANLSIPPTSEGPGFILPDSPFFFLDKIKQTVRLALAFNPETKAKVNADIAGERLAELRIMLLKNNAAGIRSDLRGISEHLKQSAEELSLARLSGRNIASLAEEINTRIKNKQNALDMLETQARGELKEQVRAVQSALLLSKVKVEDALPGPILENEIRDDIERQTRKKVDEASHEAKEMERKLSQLQKEASTAAAISLTKREEALRRAIAAKNEALKKVAEKLLEFEQKKQRKLLEAQSKAALEAREAIRHAQEAAKGFRTAQDAVNEIRNQSPSATFSAQ